MGGSHVTYLLCATRAPPSLLSARETRAGGGGSMVTGPVGAPRGGGAVRGQRPRAKPRLGGGGCAGAGDAIEAGRRRRQRWCTLWPLRAMAHCVRCARDAAYPRRGAASARGRGASARRPARASRRESGARPGKSFRAPPEKKAPPQRPRNGLASAYPHSALTPSLSPPRSIGRARLVRSDLATILGRRGFARAARDPRGPARTREPF